MSWLSRLWSGRATARDIFTYHDGTRERRADPLVIGRKLEDACPDYRELLAELNSPPGTPVPPGAVAQSLRDQEKDATAKLLAATRAAFGVRPLDDDGGLSEAETLGLLVAFFAFMGELAQRARPFSTSRPRDSPDSSTPPDSPTVSCAASGSTGSG